MIRLCSNYKWKKLENKASVSEVRVDVWWGCYIVRKLVLFSLWTNPVFLFIELQYHELSDDN